MREMKKENAEPSTRKATSVIDYIVQRLADEGITDSLISRRRRVDGCDWRKGGRRNLFFRCDAPTRQASAQRRIAYERTAESAATAISCTVFRNCSLWPMNSPSAVKLLIVATAPANLSVSGRMIETGGRWRLNSVGTGKIRLG
jgi:hypothetical protein